MPAMGYPSYPLQYLIATGSANECVQFGLLLEQFWLDRTPVTFDAERPHFFDVTPNAYSSEMSCISFLHQSFRAFLIEPDFFMMIPLNTDFHR